MNVLVTAGPTREYLDAVRFLSNASSGKMGFACAEAARDAGHDVTLVTGPVSLPDPKGLRTVRVVSADDMLTSLLLAVACPVLVAPAMNDRMWAHPAVQENISILKKRGYTFVEPDSGFLACGTYAKGRLANPVQIIEEIIRCVS